MTEAQAMQQILDLWPLVLALVGFAVWLLRMEGEIKRLWDARAADSSLLKEVRDDVKKLLQRGGE